MTKLVHSIVLRAQDAGHWHEVDPWALGAGGRQGAYDEFPVMSGAKLLPLEPRETPGAQSEALPQVTGQLERGTLLMLLGSRTASWEFQEEGEEKIYQCLPPPTPTLPLLIPP